MAAIQELGGSDEKVPFMILDVREGHERDLQDFADVVETESGDFEVPK